MSKSLNIKSLIESFNNVDEEAFAMILKYEGIIASREELNSISILFNELDKFVKRKYIYDGYHIGFSIPQISKEFDILRLGRDYIVNIEIKSEEIGDDKILKQLIQNEYYLKFLNEDVRCYTFVEESMRVVSLKGRELKTEDFQMLYTDILNQDVILQGDIGHLFNPSNYLISPFNSTDEFISKGYFLTSQQDEFKRIISKSIGKSGSNIITITGNAGTGKTLLTYDVVASNIENSVVIHCGILNDGQYRLKNEYGWNIYPIKDYGKINLHNFKIIVVDEAQRINPYQLNAILEIVKNKGITCIFSYDRIQCLRNQEVRNNIDEIIQNVASINLKLSKKIRTNKGVANFIRGLLNAKFKSPDIDRKNIDVKYFNETKSAQRYLYDLSQSDWKVINYTPSSKQNLTYDEYNIMSIDNAHRVIGQEFDNVVVVIDKHFVYNENGALMTKGHGQEPYYNQVRMFFQIVTRVRIKLRIIVVNNDEMLKRCLYLLSN